MQLYQRNCYFSMYAQTVYIFDITIDIVIQVADHL